MSNARGEMPHAPASVFGFLKDTVTRGLRGVLVTLMASDKRFVRDPGAQMAVAADGTSLGSFSGGCVERAIVARALETLEEGAAIRERYGQGSRFIDIRLPCGGGIELLFQPDPDPAMVAQCADWERARQPFTLSVGPDRALAAVEGLAGSASSASETLNVPHVPRLRIVVAGHGLEPVALARLARGFGADIVVLATDEDTARCLAEEGLACAAEDARHVPIDAWTGVALMFHDHDQERPVIERALGSPAFYIGAMGSRTTQARRRGMLRSWGYDDAAIARVHGPIGLIPDARDPDVLALSALAEIVAAQRSSVG